MAGRKSSSHTINWTPILFVGGILVSLCVTLMTFYYTTNATLANHEKQFQEVGKKFDEFTKAIKDTAAASKETSEKNFKEWMAHTKEEQNKADKVRDQLSAAITTLTTNAVATKVQVDSITKNVDSLISKIDGISSVQQENRIRQGIVPSGRK